MESKFWHLPFSAAVAAFWAWFLHNLAPHYADFVAAVPFMVVLGLWWLNMLGGTALAVLHYPILIEGEPAVQVTDTDGHGIFKADGDPLYRKRRDDDDAEPVLRKWSGHVCRRGCFRFLLLYCVLEATFSLRCWHSPALQALACAVEGHIIAMEFAKICKNFGQLLGDKGLQDAGSAVQGGAAWTFFRWIRGKK